VLLKESIKDYVKDFDYTDCFGVSLTLKQFAENQPINPMLSSQNLRHFLNMLNRKCFGKSSQRFGKRLRVLPVLERSKSGRYHYHLTLQNPFTKSPHKFESLIEETWQKTRFGYNHIHIDRLVDWGWIDYTTKLNTKDDSVDWINFEK